MTERDFRRAEYVAAAIVEYLIDRGRTGHTGRRPHGPVDAPRGNLGGEQLCGWRAWHAWPGQLNDPPDTIDGWAGWLAAEIVDGAW